MLLPIKQRLYPPVRLSLYFGCSMKLTKGDAVKYVDPESGLLDVLLQSGWVKEGIGEPTFTVVKPSFLRHFIERLKQ